MDSPLRIIYGEFYLIDLVIIFIRKYLIKVKYNCEWDSLSYSLRIKIRSENENVQGQISLTCLSIRVDTSPYSKPEGDKRMVKGVYYTVAIYRRAMSNYIDFSALGWSWGVARSRSWSVYVIMNSILYHKYYQCVLETQMGHTHKRIQVNSN